MSYLHPDGRGRYDPADLVIWRDESGVKEGLTREVRRHLEIAVSEMTATLDAPWELILKEKVKPGRSNVYGKWFFDLRQDIWLTDRGSAPNTENGAPTNTRVIYYGKVEARSTEKGPDGDYYVYRCTDRRGLMRGIPVTFGGSDIATPFETQGPNRIVYNAPPNDADQAFDPLGGSRSDLQTILNNYFQRFGPALQAVANFPGIISFDIEGFVASDLIPGKIVLEDVDFEQGLNQILASFPYIRWYVTPGWFQPQVIFVSPLRLTKTHIIDYPEFDSPSADLPVSTSWSAETSGVYTAVRITAKTGRIKNNWTRRSSGIGFDVEQTAGGASVIPSAAPNQPGKTVGIKVNTADAAYYEAWADGIRLNQWGGERYWNYNLLPDGGGGTKRPIFALQMWEQRFEEDLRGDGSGFWTGYRQPEILSGHYYNGRRTSGAANLTMNAVTTDGSGGTEQIPALITATINLAGDNGFIYKLTDSERFWYTAPLVGSAEPGGGVGAVTIRRRRGPWAGGTLVIPPQAGDARPIGMKDPARQNDPIRLTIQITNGTEIYATVVPEQRPYVSNFLWGGPNQAALWGYEVHEPGNKLRGPDNLFYSIGGRWSGMYRNYRLFDPEMVWRYVDSQGGTDRPRFAAFAQEVCFVGLITRTKPVLSPGHTGPIPDPDNDPTGAWKQESSTVFVPLFPKVGGHPDTNSAFFSTGPAKAYDAVENPPGSGTFSIYQIPFDVQFGWYELGGGVEARFPTSGFLGEGAQAPYHIKRERVIGVDLSEFIDVEETTIDQGNLGERLETIAHQYWRTLNKIPRVGQVQLDGLDFDLCTVMNEGPTPMKPFTYYIAHDLDQPDLKPPPGGDAANASAAATVGIRYDMEEGTTTIDLTEDRSGFQRDLIGELTSELRSRQLVFDIRNTVNGFKYFAQCIRSGEAGADGGAGISNGPGDLCSYTLPHPERAEDYISICSLLGIMWLRGGKKSPPQPKHTGVLIPIGDGVVTTGGMVEFEADPDVNPLVHRFDEYPNNPLGGPPLSRSEFVRRGSQFIWDSAMQPIVGEFYGNKSRYRLLGAKVDPVDGVTHVRDTTITPRLAGWGTGPVLAYLYDFLGWTPAFDLKIAEDEDGAPVPFSVTSRAVALRNGDFTAWRLFKTDEIPSECCLYLDFEEASGSLYDLSRFKSTLTATGSATYGASGLGSGERAITMTDGSVSFAYSPGSDHPSNFGWNPFAFLLRFKITASGITNELVDFYTGSPVLGVRIQVNSSNRLVFIVGDGTNVVTVTHADTLATGTWYSFLCYYTGQYAIAMRRDGSTSSADATSIGKIVLPANTLTVTGSATWDELALLVGGDYANELPTRAFLPTSWRSLAIKPGNRFPSSISTAVADGDSFAAVFGALFGTNNSVLYYQDSLDIDDLVLLPGHHYTVTFKARTKTDSPVVSLWVENVDRRQLLKADGTFTDGPTDISSTPGSSAFETITETFTVPATHEATDVWRFGVHLSSGGSVGTVEAYIDSFTITEVADGGETTEYKLVDSDGTRLAAIDADDRVAALA